MHISNQDNWKILISTKVMAYLTPLDRGYLITVYYIKILFVKLNDFVVQSLTMKHSYYRRVVELQIGKCIHYCFLFLDILTLRFALASPPIAVIWFSKSSLMSICNPRNFSRLIFLVCFVPIYLRGSLV